LRIPALSAGWKSSFEATLQQMAQPASRTGNAGLASPEQMVTAAPRFRSLKVARIDRESSSVVSLVLEPADARPLTVPLPGQYVVLRLRPKADAPPVLRSYSLSARPDTGRYRISVKQELQGVASTYVSTQLRNGDVLDVSEPRGAFTLRQGDLPAVLLSTGVGVTPVMAMLHALAAQASVRPVWWIFGARNRVDHPFAGEARDLLAKLPNARSHVQYSRPDPTDRLGFDFDAAGRLTVTVLEELGVPLESDFYLCGPPAFLADFTAGLGRVGVWHMIASTPRFSVQANPSRRAWRRRRPSHRTRLPDPLAKVQEFHLHAPGSRFPGTPGSRACWNLPKPVTVPVRWSCRTGVCHTCECGLISGSVKYDPEPLDAPAVGNLLICCAPAGRHGNRSLEGPATCMKILRRISYAI
jgi:ferredoxin-NADP reductase